jgi:hypothetical protein
MNLRRERDGFAGRRMTTRERQPLNAPEDARVIGSESRKWRAWRE